MPPKILSGLTIVVVEDHDDVRSVLAQFLRQQGARIIGCSKAYDALEAVVHERPDLVLSDIGLPDGDGFHLLQSVRSLGPEIGGKTPVIPMIARWLQVSARTWASHLPRSNCCMRSGQPCVSKISHC